MYTRDQILLKLQMRLPDPEMPWGECMPPCGHRPKLAMGGMTSSPQPTLPLAQGPLEVVQVGHQTKAVVADHAPSHGPPAASCLKLRSETPCSTGTSPSYRPYPWLSPLPDE